MHNIFDSHAHYDDKQFAADRAELLAAMPGKGVRYIMNAASNLPTARVGIALARKFPHVYCSVGVHPHDAKSAPKELEQHLRELALSDGKVRAIGEIGLDYHYNFSPRILQLEVFERQLKTARELDMPVIVHDREAHADTLALLQAYRPKGVVHCFSGSAELARELVKLGLFIGFTGVVTFKNAKKPLEAAKAVPIDRLLVETDCPYMAPEPHRGKRCDSAMLPGVIQALADAKGMDAQELCDRTCRNACEVYGIPFEGSY